MGTVEQVRLIPLHLHQDKRGQLVVADHLPFTVKRVFWLAEVPQYQSRANHAHKKCHQLIIPQHGTVAITINNTTEFVLDVATVGLYVPPGNYITLSNFSADAICLVLASDHYNAQDYI